MANTTSRQTLAEAPDPRSHHCLRRPHRSKERSGRRQRQPQSCMAPGSTIGGFYAHLLQAGDGRRGGPGHPRRFIDPVVGRPLSFRRTPRRPAATAVRFRPCSPRSPAPTSRRAWRWRARHRRASTPTRPRESLAGEACCGAAARLRDPARSASSGLRWRARCAVIPPAMRSWSPAAMDGADTG